MSKQKIRHEDIEIEATDGREYSPSEMRTNGPTLGVRVTHKPTGVSFTELEGRNQVINKNIALTRLGLELIKKGWKL